MDSIPMPLHREKTKNGRIMREEQLTRRSFMGLVGVSGMTILAGSALAGCGAWTPRSQAANSVEPVSDHKHEPPEVAEISDDLILIEGGTFLMGSPENESWRGEDEVQHEVAVSSFYLAPRETTGAEYAAVMGGRASDVAAADMTWRQAIEYCNALSAREGLSPAYAVEGADVTWNRASLGYRLPTEAEWEYACRAGSTTPFNTGEGIDPDTEANYYGQYPYNIEQNYFSQGNLDIKPGQYRQAPIAPGSFGANAWGVFDMHGNVAEWVWDAYSSYGASPAVDPTGPATGALRVNRGGGWNDFAKNLRSAYRASLPADASSPSVGIRLARNAEPGTGVVGAFSPASTATSAGEGIIVFFSWNGNTRQIAREIASQTGFRAVELELEQPYSTNYSTCLDEAQRDQNQQARTALKTHIDDFDKYSTVIVGYPNWWASIPMPIATFLESYNFVGKTILPFSSNGGGGLGQSVSAISKLAPDATIGNALAIYYAGGADMPSDVSSWLESNGIGA